MSGEERFFVGAIMLLILACIAFYGGFRGALEIADALGDGAPVIIFFVALVIPIPGWIGIICVAGLWFTGVLSDE